MTSSGVMRTSRLSVANVRRLAETLYANGMVVVAIRPQTFEVVYWGRQKHMREILEGLSEAVVSMIEDADGIELMQSEGSDILDSS